jgi:hypothetical protein
MSSNASMENEITAVDVKESTTPNDPNLEAQEAGISGKYVKFSGVVLISIVLCLATFCVAVDNTIISTAVPRITQSFHSIDDVGWYAS